MLDTATAVQKSYVVYRESFPGNWEEEGRFASEENAVLHMRDVQKAFPLQTVDITKEYE